MSTTNRTEVFPEPRKDRADLLAGTGLVGHDFNQFFPWQINEDGTEEETLNHVGRHELGGSYGSAAGFSFYVGGKYFFTNNFAALAELGYGVSYLNVGVALKF